MSRKKKTIDSSQRFSARQYFEDDSSYCPFKDVKLKPVEKKPEAKKPKALTQKDYDMFSPGIQVIADKDCQMPLSELLDCEPKDSLDLHGIRPEKNNIAELVNEFLEESFSEGIRKVAVITGKGNHSQGDPVVKEIALSAIKASRIVRDVRTAPQNKGGEGAFWVILGKRSNSQAGLVVYTTKQPKEKGTYIKGIERIGLEKKTAKPLSYDDYLPQAGDIIDKGR